MKIKKKYVGWNGYVRYNGFEISWNFRQMALPLAVDASGPLIFIQILFVTFIFGKQVHSTWI